MLKILQARFQQYMNQKLLDAQTGFRKGRGTRDQVANIHWIIEKAREIQKDIYFCFTEYAKAFDCVDHNKLWKILKEMENIRLPYLFPEKMYVGQETIVRTRHGTMDWLKIEKAIWQGCVLSLCFFNLYAEWKWKFLSHLQLFVTPWTI